MHEHGTRHERPVRNTRTGRLRLSKLRAGDEVVVERADSAVVRFIVDRIGQFRKRRFPTAEVYGPTPTPTLRLLTCAGPFHGRYRDNLVVFAHLQP
jgi:hypothetical protein